MPRHASALANPDSSTADLRLLQALRASPVDRVLRPWVPHVTWISYSASEPPAAEPNAPTPPPSGPSLARSAVAGAAAAALVSIGVAAAVCWSWGASLDARRDTPRVSPAAVPAGPPAAADRRPSRLLDQGVTCPIPVVPIGALPKAAASPSTRPSPAGAALAARRPANPAPAPSKRAVIDDRF